MEEKKGRENEKERVGERLRRAMCRFDKEKLGLKDVSKVCNKSVLLDEIIENSPFLFFAFYNEKKRKFLSTKT